MAEKLPKEKIGLFDQIVKSLSAAIKNTALYPSHHPTLIASTEALKTHLETWLARYAAFDLGMSQEDLLLEGEFVREGNALYRDVAVFLHRRGLAALSVSKGITTSELIKFFTFVKDEPKGSAEKEGAGRAIPQFEHILIKEIDYSTLLAGGAGGVSVEEKEIWQSISRISEESKKGLLPESKNEFLTNFLKDAKRSASVLNKIYRDARSRIDERSAARDIKTTIANISRYFQARADEGAKEARKELADIILNLDPGLLSSIFEEIQAGGGQDDLSREIFGEFSDEMIADFITSLVNEEGRMNEEFLKLFDKLALKEKRPGAIASAVADNLFEKGLLEKGAAATLRESIKDMLKSNPEGSFLSQVYRVTIESVLDKNARADDATKKISPMVREYMELVKDENLLKEKIRLLLDILWIEENPDDFKMMCGVLELALAQALAQRNIRSVKEAVEFFTEKMRPEQKSDRSMAAEAHRLIGALGTESATEKLIALLPSVKIDEAREVAYILKRTSADWAKTILIAIISENDPGKRNGYITVLSEFGSEVVKEIAQALEGAAQADLGAVTDLFKLFKSLDPRGARAVAKNMFQHANAALRMQAFEAFAPETDDEVRIVFEGYKKETDPVFKKKLLGTMLRSGNAAVTERLFSLMGKGFSKRGDLLELVKSCGDFKVRAALPYLAKIVGARPFFYTKDVDALRVAAVVSLAQIGGEDSLRLIQGASGARSPAVRRMCGIMLELNKKEKRNDLG